MIFSYSASQKRRNHGEVSSLGTHNPFTGMGRRPPHTTTGKLGVITSFTCVLFPLLSSSLSLLLFNPEVYPSLTSTHSSFALTFSSPPLSPSHPQWSHVLAEPLLQLGPRGVVITVERHFAVRAYVYVCLICLSVCLVDCLVVREIVWLVCRLSYCLSICLSVTMLVSLFVRLNFHTMHSINLVTIVQYTSYQLSFPIF